MLNVLIVEDEPVILEDLAAMVREYPGVTSCTACSDPISALEEADRQSFDVALLDIEMPEMNGVDLALRLKDQFPWLKFCFVTAYNNFAAEAFNLEAVDYVLKPVRQERLFKMLDKVIASSSDRRQHPVRADQAPSIRIQVFGRLAIYMNDEILRWKRQKSAEIFAYLLLHRSKPVNKFQLCEELMPGLSPDKALVNLQTAIYQLRRNLAGFTREQIQIEYGDNCYRMRINSCDYDLATFEQTCDQAGKAGSDLGRVLYPEQIRHLLEQLRQSYPARVMEYDGWLWSIPFAMHCEHRFQTALSSLTSKLPEDMRAEWLDFYQILQQNLSPDELIYEE